MKRQRHKRTTPEALVTRQIRDLLKFSRVFHWKQFQTLGSPPGISDVIGISTVRVQDLVERGVEEVGVFFACEIKAPRGRLSEAQMEFLERVQDAGGIGFMAKSIEDVQEALGLPVAFGGARSRTAPRLG